MAREIANDAVEEELREFAEPGEPPAEAAPGFEASLRETLWRMLRRRLGRDGADPERSG